ncbi:MAG TPA: universal stress protein [Terriglobales bacterium]|nr:universal stress protein [Terriglobales bacterium]
MPGRRHTTFRKILVGYDGSAQAEKAADTAVAFARALDSKVLILAVARPPEPALKIEVNGVLDDAREHYQQGFARLIEAAKEQGVDLVAEVVVGHPAEQLIHRAEKEKADLIILGRRGTSMFEKWIIGSISEKVLRYAHCPVLVVR